jgi:hypothetical protein
LLSGIDNFHDAIASVKLSIGFSGSLGGWTRSSMDTGLAGAFGCGWFLEIEGWKNPVGRESLGGGTGRRGRWSSGIDNFHDAIASVKLSIEGGGGDFVWGGFCLEAVGSGRAGLDWAGLEWLSLLRHILHAADPVAGRWAELRAAAEAALESQR